MRKNGISAKILVKNVMSMQRSRDEEKQECKILNVLFSTERKMLNFMVIYLKRKRNFPSPAKDICE
jgi:hypothetical protein